MRKSIVYILTLIMMVVTVRVAYAVPFVSTNFYENVHDVSHVAVANPPIDCVVSGVVFSTTAYANGLYQCSGAGDDIDTTDIVLAQLAASLIASAQTGSEFGIELNSDDASLYTTDFEFELEEEVVMQDELSVLIKAPLLPSLLGIGLVLGIVLFTSGLIAAAMSWRQRMKVYSHRER